MKKLFFAALIAGISAMGLTGCSEHELSSNLKDPQAAANYLSAAFDYSTNTDFELKINLGRMGRVQIYDVDPQVNVGAEPIDGAIIPENGVYSSKINLSTSLMGRTLWAKCSSGIVEATLKKDGVTFNFPADVRSRTVPEGYTDEKYPNLISAYGMDEPEDYVEICSSREKTFHDLLPIGENNQDLIEAYNDGKDLEFTISESNGDTRVPIRVSMMDYGDGDWENAENAYMQLYYYYYERGAGVQSVMDAFDDVKSFYDTFVDEKFMMCCHDPNDWHSAVDNGGSYTYNTRCLGRTQPIFYYGQDYNEPMLGATADNIYDDKYNFPKGVTVGFFMLQRGMQGTRPVHYIHFCNSNGAYAFHVDDIEDHNLSIEQWKSEVRDGKIHNGEGAFTCYAAAFMLDGDNNVNIDGRAGSDDIHRLVFSLEDQMDAVSKRDCDDEMFMISVKGDIDTDIEEIFYTWKREGTYCFEDYYPSQGDYDMNDAVVKYKYFATCYDRAEEEVTQHYIKQFRYELEIVNNGATYDNDFYLGLDDNDAQMNPNGVKLIFPGCKVDADREKNKVIGSAVMDGHSAVGDPLAVCFINKTLNSIWYCQQDVNDDVYENGELKGSYTIKVNRGINPFIYCKTTGEQVHLTKFRYRPIPGIDVQQDKNRAQDLRYYYIDCNNGTNDYKAPFALDIQTTTLKPFTVVEETVDINLFYPEFRPWVESNGTSNTDWWQHPRAADPEEGE